MSVHSRCANGHSLRDPDNVWKQLRAVRGVKKLFRMCRQCNPPPWSKSKNGDWEAFRTRCIQIDEEILNLADRQDIATRVEAAEIRAKIAALRDEKDRTEAELMRNTTKRGDAAKGRAAACPTS